MASQTCGTTARVAQSSTPSNVAHNRTHFEPRQHSGSVSRHDDCEHAKLRLLIEPLRNVFQAYCTSCFHQGPTAAYPRAAVRGFWAGMVGQHFTSNGYAHAASLSGYWGPENPRYTTAELVAMGLLS